jgi:hypothetical protein
VVVAGCSTHNTATTTSRPSTPVASPTTPIAPPTPGPATTSGPDALDAAYLDDDASNRAYWQRAVELLAEQDNATLQPDGDVSITIVHNGQSVTLYRNDLGSIAFNSCSGLVNHTDAAQTVGWIKDAFDLQRRWEAAQIRTAAIDTKCPTLKH